MPDMRNDPPDLASRAIATLVGQAIGDALGTTVEFQPRGSFLPVTDMVGGGVFDLPVGGWTDDTSMALALGTSLAACGTFDPDDVMRRFVDWYQNGAYSHTGHCFDIGNTTHDALLSYIADPSTPWHGATDTYSAGNGGIMRVAPVFARYATDPASGIDVAIQQSRLTHAHPSCDMAARELATCVYAFYAGDIPDALAPLVGVDVSAVSSRGYVVDTLHAALWAIANTHTFADAVLCAVNLGDDADTVGAVTGLLAGAKYGLHAIPSHWRTKLVWSDTLHALGRDLFHAGSETSHT
jgi:ADP-ribosyl-[dinitrogen reductase] hydrolase